MNILSILDIYIYDHTSALLITFACIWVAFVLYPDSIFTTTLFLGSSIICIVFSIYAYIKLE